MVDAPAPAPAPAAGRPRQAPAWAAALAGAAAGFAAIAAAELFAGLVAGAPSLVVAVGDVVIAFQPPGAKDLVVALFGTNDKLALQVVIVLVAVAIAAGAGVLASRRFRNGAALFVVFGLVAALAGQRDPLSEPLYALVGGIVAVGVGLAVLRALLELAGGIAPAAPAAIRAAPATPAALATPMPDWDRRRFLIASAGTIGGAVAATAVGRTLLDARTKDEVVVVSRLPAALEPAPPLAAGQELAVEGITPLVVANDDFYRIDTALIVPRVRLDTWRLEVTGMVDRPMSFTYDELLEMPLFEQHATIACVSNAVGGDLVGNALWTGVRLRDVLDAAGVQEGATQVLGRSVDGFTAGFPTAWAIEPGREAMIAVGMNRELLPVDHGFPARLIVPGLYGYVSATKWLAAIELTRREDVDGYWIPLGWAKDAPILTQSRIDVPAQDARIPAGSTEVAGVAWAPDRGVAGVEVRIDDGPWQPARTSRPISDATWLQWAFAWEATPGRHRVEVRATDGDGDTQTEERTDAAPDGARGHHRISVSVE
jgi:DMSO/TMAO reductase YedYZ molybdopterin-dependent catalytic subunit